MGLNKKEIIFSNIHSFLCAARHLSFTRAAEELFLTQSAVSHRLRKLEDILGLKLFQRLPRKVALTEEGEQLFSLLEPMVRQLDSEISHILNRSVEGILNIAATPSLTQNWLLPRLPDFNKQHPQIMINLKTRSDIVDFRTELIDIAIYYGDGHYPGLRVNWLMDEYLFPVCSPTYADTHKLWKAVPRISDCLLLHDSMPWPKAQYFSEWEIWANNVGLKDINFENSYWFNRSDLAALSARNGLGLSMGRYCVIEKMLINKELVDPFGLHCRSPHSYFIACSHEKYNTPRIMIFRHWLEEQAKSNPPYSLNKRSVRLFLA